MLSSISFKHLAIVYTIWHNNIYSETLNIIVSNKKKTNRLTFSECKELLEKLDKHKDSKYYHDVLNQFNKLLPKSVPHKPKNKD
ncbi:hypothetical protein EB118_22455 [bacterium]|nr:hypothetical protein [bacterium]NDG32818.1 hypothetical protein [bacterium]